MSENKNEQKPNFFESEEFKNYSRKSFNHFVSKFPKSTMMDAFVYALRLGIIVAEQARTVPVNVEEKTNESEQSN